MFCSKLHIRHVYTESYIAAAFYFFQSLDNIGHDYTLLIFRHDFYNFVSHENYEAYNLLFSSVENFLSLGLDSLNHFMNAFNKAFCFLISFTVTFLMTCPEAVTFSLVEYFFFLDLGLVYDRLCLKICLVDDFLSFFLGLGFHDGSLIRLALDLTEGSFFCVLYNLICFCLCLLKHLLLFMFPGFLECLSLAAEVIRSRTGIFRHDFHYFFFWRFKIFCKLKNNFLFFSSNFV